MFFLSFQFIQLHFLFLETQNFILKYESSPPNDNIQSRLSVDTSTPQTIKFFSLTPEHFLQTYVAHQFLSPTQKGLGSIQ